MKLRRDEKTPKIESYSEQKFRVNLSNKKKKKREEFIRNYNIQG